MMKKVFFTTVPLLFVLIISTLQSCKKVSPTNEILCETCAKQFAAHFYGLQLDDAARFCTPESQKWLRFYASGLTAADVAVIDSLPYEPTVSVDGVQRVDDSTSVVSCTVSNALNTSAIGETGHVVDEMNVKLTLVKRGEVWLVKMEGLPQSET